MSEYMLSEFSFEFKNYEKAIFSSLNLLSNIVNFHDVNKSECFLLDFGESIRECKIKVKQIKYNDKVYLYKIIKLPIFSLKNGALLLGSRDYNDLLEGITLKLNLKEYKGKWNNSNEIIYLNDESKNIVHLKLEN